MLRSLTPHVTLWRCAQIRLLQPVWLALFAVIRAAGAGAVYAHDSYRPPRSPPLALDSLHAHGVVPHLLLAVRRGGSRTVQQTTYLYMNIPENPGPISAAILATGHTAPQHESD